MLDRSARTLDQTGQSGRSGARCWPRRMSTPEFSTSIDSGVMPSRSAPPSGSARPRSGPSEPASRERWIPVGWVLAASRLQRSGDSGGSGGSGDRSGSGGTAGRCPGGCRVRRRASAACRASRARWCGSTRPAGSASAVWILARGASAWSTCDEYGNATTAKRSPAIRCEGARCAGRSVLVPEPVLLNPAK